MTTDIDHPDIDRSAAAERELPEFNAMQRVKRRFFAMRNGELARQMSERGARYRINFGLNLPQISEIARDFKGEEGTDLAELARRLRENSTTRESMLIAPMLFPVEQLGEEEAWEWAEGVPTPEVADILCLKLLRNYKGAAELADRLMAEADDLRRYTGLRLLLNLIQKGDYKAATPAVILRKTEVEQQRGCNLTAGVCRQLRDEIEFMEPSTL